MNILKNILYSLIYLADKKYPIDEKMPTIIKLILTFSPIAFFLDIMGGWFCDNAEFVVFFLVTVIINAGLGIKKHLELKDFSFEQFFKKTSVMLLVVISVYILLSIIVVIAGENTIAKGFEVVIQIMTLMYPISKSLKSCFVISNGEYPPKWIMKKMYKYQESGSLSELFKNPEEDEKK